MDIAANQQAGRCAQQFRVPQENPVVAQLSLNRKHMHCYRSQCDSLVKDTVASGTTANGIQ
jgi:hypothetical protein